MYMYCPQSTAVTTASFRPGVTIMQPWVCVLVKGIVATGGSSTLLKVIYAVTVESIIWRK